LPVTRPWWRRPGGLALAGIVVASFLFWIYALSGLAKREPPDTLQDPTFATRAEPRCATTAAAVARLPAAPTARTPAERADTVEIGTGLLRSLVTDLRVMAPQDGPDRALVLSWLDDWNSYLDSRDDYARRVRTDPRARFLIDDRDGQAITVPMDNLATVNRMPSCVTPGDV
jgi:hypothetical protein